MKVKVKVPATSANLGPGFDVAGLALTLYNTFTFELADQGLNGTSQLFDFNRFGRQD